MKLALYIQYEQFTILPTFGIVWGRSNYGFGISFMWLKWGFIFKFNNKKSEE